MLHYGNVEPFSTIVYVCFALAWFPTRHGIYFYIFSEVYNVDAPGVSNGAITKNIQTGFIVALAVFQGLLLMWLRDLLRGIYNAVVNSEVKDHREVNKKKKS